MRVELGTGVSALGGRALGRATVYGAGRYLLPVLARASRPVPRASAAVRDSAAYRRGFAAQEAKNARRRKAAQARGGRAVRGRRTAAGQADLARREARTTRLAG